MQYRIDKSTIIIHLYRESNFVIIPFQCARKERIQIVSSNFMIPWPTSDVSRPFPNIN